MLSPIQVYAKNYGTTDLCTCDKSTLFCRYCAREDKEALRKAAVHTFMTQDVCLAIVLHAGAAAAGLTLTAAQNVILLEPFLRQGDELQAAARCHRIGQTKQTTCFTLYMKGALVVRWWSQLQACLS